MACLIGGTSSASDAPAPGSILAPAEGGTPLSAPQDGPKPATKAEAEKVSEGWRRKGFAFSKGKSKIEIVGYAQEDFRHFDWSVKGDETGTRQAPVHELRRLRIGSKARFRNLTFEFVADPRNSEKGSRLKDATVGYDFAKGFNVLVGHFKPPVSQEFLTSAGKTDFGDRSMIADRLGPDREWGIGADGDFAHVHYAVGFFAGDGASSSQSAGNSGAARLTLKPVKGLDVSASFMQGEVTADPRVGAVEPLPKGASGQTASGFTFWDRPHVNGTRRRLGGDVSYSRGPFRLQGEYLENREQRKGQGSTGQDIPDVRGRGWSAQASYLLTGEKKDSTVAPRRSILKGGLGAVEIVARVEALKFDDTGDPSGFEGYGNRARNIAPSGASAIQAGINYWASSFFKLQGSALWESYNDPLIAPVPGNTGRYFTLIGRVQVMIP
jgi:phosphate-selective porin